MHQTNNVKQTGLCLNGAYNGIYSKNKDLFQMKDTERRRIRILWVSFTLNLLSHAILCFKRGNLIGKMAMGTRAGIRETGG